MPTVGPTLPPHLAKRKRSEEPSPPPGPSPRSRSSSADSASKRRRVIGPAPPPAPLSERPPNSPSPTRSEASDSDSDFDFGPSLPPAPGSQAAQQAEREHVESGRQAAAEEASKKPQREEWMLVPPSKSDWSTRVDPTKLKNRKFQTGKGARAPAAGGGGDNAVWTETPEDKRRRLEDEVMGRQKESDKPARKADGGGDASRGKGEEDDKETGRRIREYNEKKGKSLLEAHKQARKGKEEDDDPSKRAFDREKDMGLATRLGEGKKREIIRNAANFTSRFDKGSYL